MPNESTKQEVADRFQELLASVQTLTLATANAEATPDSSYAPFVRGADGDFYIFVSALASHTGNLLNNPKASVLFMRPETASPNLFARERAVLSCRVENIAKDDIRYHEQLQALQDKFGEVVGILRALPDFHLFALHPETGRYILGFGKAHTLNANDGILSPLL
ncbi:MAG: pyridoxamine 5'-phosphate oxidase family protein [Methylococcales bacterium]|nr:pyridoxamine 5'-phosphate oxidase family protein [Methylococcales bacterium]